MGSNDRQYNANQHSKIRRNRGELLQQTWPGADDVLLLQVIAKVSELGGYIGLGRSADGSVLLLYIRLDDASERIAIDTPASFSPTLQQLLEEL